MAKQRIRVRGVDAQIVAAISLLAGALAVEAGSSPTGTAVIDVLLVVASAAACVWAAASAPWWAGVAAAAVATAIAPDASVVVVGAIAVVGGLAVGLARRAVPWSRALVAGAAIQVFARLGNIHSFGLTSLIAVVCVGALAILGFRRRTRTERRLMRRIGTGVAAFFVVAVVGCGVAALEARADLEAGNQKTHEALDLLGQGDFAGARASFERAAVSFDRADSALGRPWGQLARVVPVVGQHRNSAVDLVGSARNVTNAAAGALASVDIDALRVVNGKIDTSAIGRLQAPLKQLNESVDELWETVADVDSPWLVGALSSRLDDLKGDISLQQERGQDALIAVQQAPAMLGADGARVYFVAFTTPAEARGLGGFMGNWAELTITDGLIELTGFGRDDMLNEQGNVGAKTLTGPDDLIANYGDWYLSDIENAVVGPGAWSNITASPDFPAVGQVISQLYPQSGGRHLDGVFSMDIETIARLMQISGPVHLDDLGLDITSDTVVPFLMRDQYFLPDNADRQDALEAVARATVSQLLTSELPSPPDLAELLSPMTAQGRLLGWAEKPEEQEVFDRIGMSGALPSFESDALAIRFNNGGGNKIDDLLDASASYSVSPDEATGLAEATLTITLTNTAPATGLPDYIIGNINELPAGTNSTFLSVYTSMPYTSTTVNDVPTPFDLGEDGPFMLMTALIDMPPGSTTVVEMTLEGGIDLSNGYSLLVDTPPTARPFTTDVIIDGEPVDASGSSVPGLHLYSQP
jgi:hypothetical protein